ncbi:Tnf Receptor-Associated Factor 4 [Manis pentadactyla]|nr:Tnf Receptor-Associated Factor 4 [Manis pentadactyla]
MARDGEGVPPRKRASASRLEAPGLGQWAYEEDPLMLIEPSLQQACRDKDALGTFYTQDLPGHCYPQEYIQPLLP